METQKTPDELKQQEHKDALDKADKNFDKKEFGENLPETVTNHGTELAENTAKKFGNIPEESKKAFKNSSDEAKKALETEIAAIGNNPNLKPEEQKAMLNKAMEGYLDKMSKAYTEAMKGDLKKDELQKMQDDFEKTKQEKIRGADWIKEAQEARKQQEVAEQQKIAEQREALKQAWENTKNEAQKSRESASESLAKMLQSV